MNKIIINRGSFKLDEVEFKQGSLTIGRAADNDIKLDDDAISSHHAKIVTLFKTSYIEDLDSTNGTLVNGKTILKHTLRSGDVIAVGNHQLLFQSDESGKKSGDDDDTMVMRKSDISERLNEYIQARNSAGNVPERSPGATGNVVSIEPKKAGAQNKEHSPAPKAADENIQTSKSLADKATGMEAQFQSAGLQSTGLQSPGKNTGNGSTDAPGSTAMLGKTERSIGESKPSGDLNEGQGRARAVRQPSTDATADGAAAHAGNRSPSAPPQSAANVTYLSNSDVADNAIKSTQDRSKPSKSGKSPARLPKLLPMLWVLIIGVLATEIVYIVMRAAG
jgi:pSer/pThr/pTyr-binding forkhead associated (FHA) protein